MGAASVFMYMYVSVKHTHNVVDKTEHQVEITCIYSTQATQAYICYFHHREQSEPVVIVSLGTYY